MPHGKCGILACGPPGKSPKVLIWGRKPCRIFTPQNHFHAFHLWVPYKVITSLHIEFLCLFIYAIYSPIYYSHHTIIQLYLCSFPLSGCKHCDVTHCFIRINLPSVCTCSAAQLCSTLCNPMDYSPPGSSVHGIFHLAAVMRGSSGPGWRYTEPTLPIPQRMCSESLKELEESESKDVGLPSPQS